MKTMVPVVISGGLIQMSPHCSGDHYGRGQSQIFFREALYMQSESKEVILTNKHHKYLNRRWKWSYRVQFGKQLTMISVCSTSTFDLWFSISQHNLLLTLIYHYWAWNNCFSFFVASFWSFCFLHFFATPLIGPICQYAAYQELSNLAAYRFPSVAEEWCKHLILAASSSSKKILLVIYWSIFDKLHLIIIF